MKQELQKLLDHPIRLVDIHSRKLNNSYSVVIKKTGFCKPKEQYIRQQFCLRFAFEPDGNYYYVESAPRRYGTIKFGKSFESMEELAEAINKSYQECLDSIPLDLEVMFQLLRKLRGVQYRIESYNRSETIHEIRIVRAKQLKARRVQYSFVKVQLRKDTNIRIVYETEDPWGYHKKDYLMGTLNPTSPNFIEIFARYVNECLVKSTKKVVYGKYQANKWLNYAYNRG